MKIKHFILFALLTAGCGDRPGSLPGPSGTMTSEHALAAADHLQAYLHLVHGLRFVSAKGAGTSMEPDMMGGDVIMLNCDAPWEAVVPGDDIGFWTPGRKSLVVHRVLERLPGDRLWTYSIYANKTDKREVRPGDYCGRAEIIIRARRER